MWSGVRRSGEQRRGRPAPALVRDGVLWAVLAAAVVVGDAYAGEPPRQWWLTASGAGLLALGTALARSRPVAAWLLAAAPALAASPQLATVSYGPALAVFGYLLGRRCAHERPALAAFAGVAVAGTAGAFARTTEDVQYADPVLVWLIMLGTLAFGAVFPWLAGRYRRQDRALVAAGWDRAERLEREQRIVAEQARSRERARIAEDMHDALGHDLSLIALRAGALQVAPDLADEHRSALAGLRGEAAQATERLRGIIGVLREPAPASAAPLAPVGETLESLVARAAASGLPARLVTGTGAAYDDGPRGDGDGPRGDGDGDGAAPDGSGPNGAHMAVREAADGLAPPVERAAYRVVREALTNAAKHAPGAEVTVAVDRVTDGTVVRVRNGPPAPGAAAAPGQDLSAEGGTAAEGGTGLVALRERVRLAGGGLAAGAHHDGGFTVTARFPAEPGADSADSADDAADSPSGAYGTHSGAPPEPAEPTPASHQFARAQRDARRSAARATTWACAVAAVVVAAVFGWYAYTTAESVLPRATYGRLHVGDPEAGVRGALPGRQESAPTLDRSPPPPAGARCAYYRADGELFTSVDVYRLCFQDGRLTDKTVIQGAGDDR